MLSRSGIFSLLILKISKFYLLNAGACYSFQYVLNDSYFIVLITILKFSTSNSLKYVDVSPTYKKDNKIDKINFRPISILPNKSKVYERLMSKQLNPLAIFFLNYSAGSVKNVILNFDLCP